MITSPLESFIYKLLVVECNAGPRLFVFRLARETRPKSSSYLAALIPEVGELRRTRASKVPENERLMVVVREAINSLLRDQPLPAGFQCVRVLRCVRCGRPLTTPTSLLRGKGPVCARAHDDADEESLFDIVGLDATQLEKLYRGGA